MKNLYLIFIALTLSLYSYALPAPITGVNSLCVGATTTLSDATTGGTWSCASSVAMVGSLTGLVTGTSAGTATVTYTAGGGYVTTVVTVSPVPSPIYPDETYTLFCTGMANNLSNSVGGGSWSSSNTTVATISPAGVFTCAAPGTTVITYAAAPGCTVSYTYTVNPLPAPITGGHDVCVGSNITLSDITPGGHWTSAGSWMAAVGSATGVVTGVYEGTVNIYYRMPTGCYSTDTMNVGALTATISGPNEICISNPTTYSSTSPDGVWTSSAPSVANIGSSSGILTGLSGGITTLTYTLPACSTHFTKTVTVVATVPPITGTTSLCTGVNYTFTDALSGGTWSSSNPSVTWVGATNGNVAASAIGTVTISYSAGFCGTATLSVSTNATTTGISGPDFLCPGGTATFTDPVPGGTWSTSTPAVGTINPVTGFLNALTPGADTVIYSVGTCPAKFPLGVYPNPGTLFGCNNLGVGDTMDFPDPLYSTWFSSNPSVASVIATGRVTGISSGTAIITNFSPYAGCVEATKTVTVTPTAHVRPLTGGDILCSGSTMALTDAVPGGTWSSSAPAVGTISTSGVLRGISFGQTIVTYTNAGYMCEQNYYVNALPNPFTGPNSICAGDTATLYAGGAPYYYWGHSDSLFTLNLCNLVYAWGYGPIPVYFDCSPPPMGYFTSSNTLVAMLPSVYMGTYVGVSGGTAIITYTDANSGCSVDTTVIVNPISVAPITGTLTTCIGTFTALSDATPGGIWTSGNTAIATVGSTTGHVTGVSSGVVNITYSNGTTCGHRFVQVTVNPGPAAITGNPGTMCTGTTATLADAVTGGVWSSSNITTAVVGSSTGVVTAVGTGTALITYTQGLCSNYVTTTVNVNTAFPITGITNICTGSTTTLTDGAGTGTWSSSNTSVATVGTATGIVTGVAGGTTVISYASSTCGPAATVVTVYPVSAITGPSVLCIGNPSTFTDTLTGGTWISSNTAVATIGSSSGIAYGLTYGVIPISYSTSAGCLVTKSITVFPLPTAYELYGGGSYCPGGAGVPISIGSMTSNTSYQLFRGTTPVGSPLTTLSGTYSFGTFTTPGSYYVIATSSYTTCSGPMADTLSVSMVTSPSTITGPSLICTGTGGYAYYNDSTAGGTWSSSSPVIGTIGATTGLLVAMSTGVLTITYSTSCGSVTKTVTISTTPTPVSGPSTLCQGATITLSDPASGGIWSTSGSAVSVGTSSGIVTGVSGGLVTISYSYASGACIATYPVTVNPGPGLFNVLGGGTYCTGTGDGYHVLLSGSATGVTYQLYNGITMVESPISGTGAMLDFGLQTAAGVYKITGTVASTGCSGLMNDSATIIVNPSPGAITGSSSICIGTGTIFTDSASGGVWSSSYTSIATVGSVSGYVNGIATGTDTVFYTLPTGCQAYTTITVGSTLPAISGPSSVCIGIPTLYTDAVTGGTWSSSLLSIASIGTSSGILTGTAVGVTIITYTTSCGYITKPVTVNTMEPPIFGPSTVCVGATIALTDAVTGGAWSATVGAATVGPVSGDVTGISTGVSTITYTVTGGCFVTKMVTVNPLPFPFGITGGGSICPGSGGVHIGTTGSATGVAYQLFLGTTGIITVTGSGTSLDLGLYFTPGIYTIRATNASGCSATLTGSVTISLGAAPTIYTVTGGGMYCPGGTGEPVYLSGSSAGVSYQLYNGTTGSGSPLAGTGSALNFGLKTAAGTYKVVATNTTSGCTDTMAGSATISLSSAPVIYTLSGGGSYCAGGPGMPIILTGSGAGVTYQLYNGTIPVGASVSGTGLSVDFGLITLAGTYRVVATNTSTGCTSIMAGSVVITILPSPAEITGSASVCTGSSITLTDATTGGTWYSLSPIATVGSSTGIVTGITGGTDSVFYTLPDGCKSAVQVTINWNPDEVIGPGYVCVGTSITLVDSTTGGDWSGSNPTLAGVGSLSGMVSGLFAGNDTITYTLPTGCNTTTIVTVDPQPVAGTISGPGNVCTDSTITLTDSVSGGEWSCSGTLASVGSSSGVVTGSMAGVQTITYSVTNICNTATATYGITINPIPVVDGVTGVDSVCPGDSILLTDATTGGVWSVSNSHASVTSGGMVRGLTAGTDTVRYTIATTSCGTAVATKLIYVQPPLVCNLAVDPVYNTATDLRVYPEPNDGSFTIYLQSDINEQVQFIFTDITGRKVYELTGLTNKLKEVKLNKAAGIYFLTAVTLHGQYVVKVSVR